MEQLLRTSAENICWKVAKRIKETCWPIFFFKFRNQIAPCQPVSSRLVAVAPDPKGASTFRQREVSSLTVSLWQYTICHICPIPNVGPVFWWKWAIYHHISLIVTYYRSNPITIPQTDCLASWISLQGWTSSSSPQQLVVIAVLWSRPHLKRLRRTRDLVLLGSSGVWTCSVNLFCGPKTSYPPTCGVPQLSDS